MKAAFPIALAPAFVFAFALASLIAWGLGALAAAPGNDDVVGCWNEVTSSRAPSAVPDCLLAATSALAAEILPERGDVDQKRLARALALGARAKIGDAATLEPDGPNRYRLSLEASSIPHELVLRGERKTWADALWDGESIVARYRALSDRLVSRYSFEYLLGELGGGGVVVLEDFEHDALGAPPGAWKRRAFGHDDGRTPYQVVEEPGSRNRFLKAEVRDENVMLYKEVRWNAREYPYLSWRWRVRSAPEGSDERVEEKADSAAGVYLSYRRKLGLVPETVKFVWSLRYPTGTAFRRPGIGMPWTLVASSGARNADADADNADARWERVVYRIEDVYEATFGGDPGERPLGIGLLSDANNTGGLAAADYDDIEALASPSPRGGSLR